MILVTGATGNVGREAVDLLLDNGVKVAAVTRDPDRAALAHGADVVAGRALSSTYSAVPRLPSPTGSPRTRRRSVDRNQAMTDRAQHLEPSCPPNRSCFAHPPCTRDVPQSRTRRPL